VYEVEKGIKVSGGSNQSGFDKDHTESACRETSAIQGQSCGNGEEQDQRGFQRDHAQAFGRHQ